MKSSSFKRLLAKLNSLTRGQRAQLLDLLRPAVSLDQVAAVIDHPARPRLCPSCGPSKIYRHGQVDGLQRFRCVACGLTFNRLTGTPLAHLRLKSRWIAYLGSVLNSTTVRTAAHETQVHRNTSFRWRHRFLDLARHDRPGLLSGIAEADELFILASEKGSRTLTRPPRKHGGVATKRGISNEQVCVLVARDRQGQTHDFVTGNGPVSKRHLRQHLLPVLERDVLLVTDANAAYRHFARETGITHEAVNLSAGERVRGALHVQNVNAYHRRLREWLVRFHGVATRYLPNYLGWRWALDLHRIDSPERMLHAAMGAFHT